MTDMLAQSSRELEASRQAAARAMQGQRQAEEALINFQQYHEEQAKFLESQEFSSREGAVQEQKESSEMETLRAELAVAKERSVELQSWIELMEAQNHEQQREKQDKLASVKKSKEKDDQEDPSIEVLKVCFREAEGQNTRALTNLTHACVCNSNRRRFARHAQLQMQTVPRERNLVKS